MVSITPTCIFFVIITVIYFGEVLLILSTKVKCFILFLNEIAFDSVHHLDFVS